MNIPECFPCTGESMTFGKLTSAEGLVIHVPFLDQSVATLLKAATTPILIPPRDLIPSRQRLVYFRVNGASTIINAVDNIAGPTAGRIDLHQVFPSGRGKSCGQDSVAVRCGIACRPQKAELEAFKTAGTSFGHLGDAECFDWHSGRTRLQPADKGQPSRVIIFIINRFEAVCGGISDQLIAADGIFPEWDDVGVAEEYSGTQAHTDHPFDDGSRAGSAAAMQQDAFPRKVATFRRLW